MNNLVVLASMGQNVWCIYLDFTECTTSTLELAERIVRNMYRTLYLFAFVYYMIHSSFVCGGENKKQVARPAFAKSVETAHIECSPPTGSSDTIFWKKYDHHFDPMIFSIQSM